MTEEFGIPAFLRRTKQGELPVTQQPEQKPQTAQKKTKRKMKDAYVAAVKITIPLDMTDPQSFATAAEAIRKLSTDLPPGAVFESEARIGKIEAA